MDGHLPASERAGGRRQSWPIARPCASATSCGSSLAGWAATGFTSDSRRPGACTCFRLVCVALGGWRTCSSCRSCSMRCAFIASVHAAAAHHRVSRPHSVRCCCSVPAHVSRGSVQRLGSGQAATGRGPGAHTARHHRGRARLTSVAPPAQATPPMPGGQELWPRFTRGEGERVRMCWRCACEAHGRNTSQRLCCEGLGGTRLP